MKKFIVIIFVFLFLNSFSQTVIYFEDFNDMPVGMTTFNVNGSTNTNCGGGDFTDGWMLSTYNGYETGENIAKDCSSHIPVQEHDSWMVTPSIPVNSSEITVTVSAYTEWNDTEFEIWASKSFDGTVGGLSDFTLVETIINGQGWLYVPHTINLNAMSLEPGDELFVAIRNAESEKGYTFINDLIVTEVNAFDANLKYCDSDRYSADATIPIRGKVFNDGAEVITSFTLNWSVDNGSVASEDFSGLNILSGDFFYFEAANSVTFPNDENELEMVISSINGQSSDDNPENDTIRKQIYIINSPTVEKHVILEDFTGCWCGNCVDAIAATNEMMEENSHFITIAIHNSDPMKNDQGGEMESAYGITAYPSMLIDRKTVDLADMISPKISSDGWPCNNWRDAGDDRLQFVTPVEVSTNHTYNENTNELSVGVIANFTDAGANGDLRINCILVENSVTGGSGYDQSNYRDNVAGHPFEGMGNPIVGFSHQHVYRASLGGVDGSENVIPEVVEKGESFQTTYSYTIPDEWDVDNLKIIGLVHEYDEHNCYREIYNASELDVITSTPEINFLEAGIKIFPNPNSGVFNLVFNDLESSYSRLVIFDIRGRKVMEKTISANSPSKIDLSECGKGLYFVEIQTDKIYGIQKVVIN